MRDRVVGQEQEQQLFFENKLTPHHTLIDLLINQEKTFDALLYGERAKGRVLLDVLRKGRVQITKAMTKEEAEEERRLNQLIVTLNSQLRDEQMKRSPDAVRIGQLREQLDSARFKYASFENVLYASHPELKTQRGQTALITRARLSALDQSSETVFVEYVVTKDKVHLFVLAKGDEGLDLKSHIISVREDDLSRLVKKLHQSISSHSLIFTGSSRALYDLLLKPVEPYLEGKSTICVIPDSILWDVPFQALLSRAGRYLIEDYGIYYAPSLSILLEMKQRKRQDAGTAGDGLLALGNPKIGVETVKRLQEQQRGDSFEPLPDAEVEVKTMAQIFGPGRSKVFTGTDANENVFKSLAPNFSTIHFATHGVLDNRQPLYSYLLLSKSEGDTNNDGLLEAREIMNLDLPADLAVLSACETARGRIGAGEGVIGMSWVLLVAGCRTTIVSQWKVDSAGTSQLMVNFYKLLLESKGQGRKTKAEALRQAAMMLMKDRKYQHPFYWAGFVVVGSDR
jgi:CHAT domain-containing protein